MRNPDMNAYDPTNAHQPNLPRMEDALGSGTSNFPNAMFDMDLQAFSEGQLPTVNESGELSQQNNPSGDNRPSQPKPPTSDGALENERRPSTSDLATTVPRWHDEESDRSHRQTMILEIAKLLQARKKSKPTTKWLQQLPHKARKLEEKLYLTAESFESYSNRTTLKSRLRKVAQSIISLHADPSRTSFVSTSSLLSESESILNDSLLDSQQSMIEASNALRNRASNAPRHSASSGAPLPSTNNFPSVDMAEISRQRKVNEELQAQIQENLRRQTEIARKLQQTGSTMQQSQANHNMSGGNFVGGMNGPNASYNNPNAGGSMGFLSNSWSQQGGNMGFNNMNNGNSFGMQQQMQTSGNAMHGNHGMGSMAGPQNSLNSDNALFLTSSMNMPGMGSQAALMSNNLTSLQALQLQQQQQQQQFSGNFMGQQGYGSSGPGSQPGNGPGTNFGGNFRQGGS